MGYSHVNVILREGLLGGLQFNYLQPLKKQTREA